MNPLDHIMGTEEASKLWGLSQDHIKRLCREGKVKCIQIGKTWVIDKNQLNPADPNHPKNKKGVYRMEQFYSMTINGFEFTKKPVIRVVTEKDEESVTKRVFFTMTVLSEYVRDIFKNEEDYQKQFSDPAKRPQIKYHASLLNIKFNGDTDDDMDLETEGLNGLPQEVAHRIIDEMKKYGKIEE